MDIIPKSAPGIDPDRLNESLERFRDYVVEVLQVIDFTLSNQKNQINGAVSEQNFLQLAAAVQSLSSEITAQNSVISGHTASISALESSVEVLEDLKTTVASLSGSVQALSGKADSLDQRVTALESASAS